GEADVAGPVHDLAARDQQVQHRAPPRPPGALGPPGPAAPMVSGPRARDNGAAMCPAAGAYWIPAALRTPAGACAWTPVARPRPAARRRRSSQQASRATG